MEPAPWSFSGDRSRPEHSLSVWHDSNVPEDERRITGMALNPESGPSEVAFTVDGGPPQIWEPVEGRHLKTLPGQAGEVLAITYAPWGALIISCDDGTILDWERPHLKPRVLTRDPAHPASRIARAGRHGLLLAADGPDGSVRVWNTYTGELTHHIDSDSHGGDPRITALVFAPDGGVLAMGTRTGAVRVVSMTSGKQLARTQCHGGEVTSLAFSPGGRRLAAGSVDRSVVLWDTDRWRKPRYVFPVGGGRVSRVAFCPEGELLGVGTNLDVRLLDVDDGRHLATLGQGPGRATAPFDFVHSGLLAATDLDGGVGFWDLRTSQQLFRMAGGHRTRPEALAVLPDGGHVITAGRDGVWVWSFRSGGRMTYYVWELL
nr:hypothetical protein [Streptomyces alkaliphilus]